MAARIPDNGCNSCNLCDAPGTFATASEKQDIPAIARIMSGEMFTVWRCSNCGSLHSKQPVDLDYCYANYAVKDHQLNFHTRIAYRNRLAALRKRGLERSNTVLDYGCGSGLFVSYLRQKQYADVSGYDRFVAEYADETCLKRRYDVVLSYDVIEHDDHPRDFLRRMAALVKPDGLLVIETPNATGISLTDWQECFMDLHQPYHRHILSEKALLALCAGHGMELLALDRRSPWDSLMPSVNSRFIWSYCQKGGDIETVIEPPNFGLVLRSPRLLFYMFAGYFYPTTGSLTAFFRCRK